MGREKKWFLNESQYFVIDVELSVDVPLHVDYWKYYSIA